MSEEFYKKLDNVTIEKNMQELCSYADMRKHLLTEVNTTRGRTKFLSERLLDLLDFVAELENGDSFESDIRSSIYYILS